MQGYIKFPDLGYLWVIGEVVVAKNKGGEFAFVTVTLQQFPVHSSGSVCCLCVFPLQDSTPGSGLFQADPICREVNSTSGVCFEGYQKASASISQCLGNTESQLPQTQWLRVSHLIS